MSIFDNATDLLPGLLPAAWRGVPFFMPDSAHDVGRRVLLTYFPGIDMPAAEDFGDYAGPINVSGVYVGADYVAVAAALELAFRTPGLGTLLHPWLGEKTVICERPASIRFADRALGLVTFDASFTPVTVDLAPVTSTLSGLLGAADLVIASAGVFITASLVGASAVAVLAHAHDTASACASVVDDTVADAPERPGLTPNLAPASAAVALAVAADSGGAASADLAAAVTGLGGPIAAAGITVPAPAISPAAGYEAPEPPITARRAVTLLRQIAAAIAGIETLNVPAAALALGARVAALAHACRAAADIAYESRQDATSVRAALDGELAAVGELAADFAQDAPGAGAALWVAIADLRAALARDLSEIIGRLPSVITVTPPYGISAWLVAQHYAGDDPRDVVAMMQDLVSRNRLRHPGLISSDTIEVLL
ncbi:DNA circularization N-terminal domain-containing protein [Ancylobacter pratisalsi]|uniref:DNA circulation N-terminal domain-containing protein n=1 Tax=Ancylobacter pratisalsi TaxID=1745854 RepID=A0A6P1YRR3_9HYPH|nr:DNA circularization N-terminal domain-containing protein [Ancylobacter pratisalsi]QIB34743.1 hypothetical protein G3A50_14285 [Ancylobacter pratisalsi]